MDPETPFPVIDLLPEQKGVEDLGGTMRLVRRRWRSRTERSRATCTARRSSSSGTVTATR